MPDENLLNRRRRALEAIHELAHKVILETESYDEPTTYVPSEVPPTHVAANAMCTEVMSLLDTRNWEDTIRLLETMTARDL